MNPMSTTKKPQAKPVTNRRAGAVQMLTRNDLRVKLNMSDRTLCRFLAENDDFPKPAGLRPGHKAQRWHEDAVDRWLNAKHEEAQRP